MTTSHDIALDVEDSSTHYIHVWEGEMVYGIDDSVHDCTCTWYTKTRNVYIHMYTSYLFVLHPIKV